MKESIKHESDKNLVSVCVPVYNGSETIVSTLQSIINQTYQNIEIIVVDNCSTDNTVEIVEGINCEKIKLYKNKNNLGMVGNWNQCLEYVNGKYVHFVCADDLLVPECIEKKVDLIQKESDIYMVFSASVIINECDKVMMRRHQYKKNCIVDGKQLAKKSYHIKNLYGEPSNVLFRKEAVYKSGKFATNTCYATDWDLWLRISCLGKVGYLDAELMKYRISTINETSKISYQKFLDDDRVMMQNIESYGCMDINTIDRVIHRIMYIVRMVARRMYMKRKSR